MIVEFIKYIESNQPIATLITGALAIFAVVLRQLWLDLRQRREHRHEDALKGQEISLNKKEELIESINSQIRSIMGVEDTFESWQTNFKGNYPNSNINRQLVDIDNRVNKIHVIIQLYFVEYLPYIEKITANAQSFHELCADFSMAGKSGERDFLSLEHVEIVEKCNEYAVGYMQLSSHLIDPELIPLFLPK